MDSARQLLHRIQQRIITPKQRQDAKGHFYYRSLDDVLIAIKPVLGEEQVMIDILSEHIEMIGDRYYAVCELELVHAPSSTVLTRAKGMAREPADPGTMAAEQRTGSAFTYAKKQALSAALMLDANPDPDAVGGDIRYLDHDQVIAMKKAITAAGGGDVEKRLLAWLKAETLNGIQDAAYDMAMQRLAQLEKKKKAELAKAKAAAAGEKK
jgi:hypothetical protein